MAKIPNKLIREHSAFLKRQRQYEIRYQNLFLRYLTSVYNTAANEVEKLGVEAYRSQMLRSLHMDYLRSIYERLYNDVTIKEAQIEEALLNSLERSQKDLIDDIASLFPYTGGANIRLFRQLLQEYLIVRIGTRITQVTSTTVEYVAKVIEQGISEGLGGRQIAGLLRRQTDFNKNRSLAIARTETVTASNQGKYMSALASNLVYEKRWIPTNQPGRTRPSHLAMLDTPFIDIEAMFMVPAATDDGGVELARYPGDESLSAGNTVNCRCSIGFRVKRDADGNPIRKVM